MGREREANSKGEMDTEIKKGSEARRELLMRSTESQARGRRNSVTPHLTDEVIVIDWSHQSICLCSFCF